ncbi:MAG: DNA polymerase III subunit delta [bacterium]|nr:DNA polymerase III subunit delta [bacterium]
MTVIFGENSFERESELAKLKNQAEKADFAIENLNVENLTEEDFVNSICGVSFLAEKRLVIIKRASDNSMLWDKLPVIISRISDDVHLCLIEEKIDKRSTIYKSIAKVADMKEQKSLSAKDGKDLAEFARKIAKRLGFSVDNKTADFLVSWVGVDEWRVRDGIERLSVLGEISKENIEKYIPQNIESNAFGIFELALNKKQHEAIDQLSRIKITEGVDGAYQFFGLISSQFFNLVALKLGQSSGKTTTEVAKELGVNAWSLGKMDQFARNLNFDQINHISEKFLQIDELLKTTNSDVWGLVEALLLDIASI